MQNEELGAEITRKNLGVDSSSHPAGDPITIRPFAACALTLVLAAPLVAQTDNQDARKVAAAQAKIDHKANKEGAKLSNGSTKAAFKAQAKADKETAKALDSHHAKKAARAQDKADAAAMGATEPR